MLFEGEVSRTPLETKERNIRNFNSKKNFNKNKKTQKGRDTGSSAPTGSRTPAPPQSDGRNYIRRRGVPDTIARAEHKYAYIPRSSESQSLRAPPPTEQQLHKQAPPALPIPTPIREAPLLFPVSKLSAPPGIRLGEGKGERSAALATPAVPFAAVALGSRGTKERALGETSLGAAGGGAGAGVRLVSGALVVVAGGGGGGGAGAVVVVFAARAAVVVSVCFVLVLVVFGGGAAGVGL
ncbi:hypothetical protein B0H11DRAFT_2182559 [Mycena galericulata]|nr:hypothetical protein B0H11DRAFT_2182559 [Mycena galericulata]